MKNIVLKYWTADTTAEQMQAAFERQNSWFVNVPQGSALWYSVVLNNLIRSYAVPNTATIETIREVLNKGLSRVTFDWFRFVTDISSEQLSKTIRVSKRTLSRRDIFRPDESERLLRVASVFQRTLDVLGSIDNARRWFVTPKRALGEKTPLDFCDTELGAIEVEHLLGRIEHGVFT